MLLILCSEVWSGFTHATSALHATKRFCKCKKGLYLKGIDLISKVFVF